MDTTQIATSRTHQDIRLPAFGYLPLQHPDDIRIVVLGRGSSDHHPIECYLLHMERHREDYEALSHEWGQPSVDEPIISVDGCPVRVRTNLRDALKELRLETEDRYLWIDALSIDQANTEERNDQVKMMGRIYKDAENVVVWLGPPSPDTDLAMDLFADPIKLSSQMLYNNLNDAPFSAVLALCERSYWRRVWIQQELYHAQRFKVHCGRKGITDKSFIYSIVVMTGPQVPCSYKMRVHVIDSLLTMRNLKESFKESSMLNKWLSRGIESGLESSEPRDFIYAVLSISSDCGEDPILPDYEKPLVEVYLETVAFCGW